MHMHLDTVLCSYSKVRGHIPALYTILLSQMPLSLMVTFRAPLASPKWFFAAVNDLFLSPTIFAAHCAYKGKVLSQCYFMNMQVMSLSFRPLFCLPHREELIPCCTRSSLNLSLSSTAPLLRGQVPIL